MNNTKRKQNVKTCVCYAFILDQKFYHIVRVLQ